MSANEWDRYAESFDEAADHGLLDPDVRVAWRELLLPLLPPAPAAIADLGCGTGSLSVLLAEAGHHVTGLDSSPEMLRYARAKAAAANVTVEFREGDAAHPELVEGSYDVVLARHILWVFDDPGPVLDRWKRLLRLDGRITLIEGRWSTGVGLTREASEALLRARFSEVEVIDLSGSDALWGGLVDDDRYLVMATDQR
ncbi:class I SAM-dependent methyltransferase [Leifsonia poae]|uniref:class I SAM-dependent methyltransferase n=1 Tax=Leifsonia poae TaxID=110933 RepID=UPI003D67BFEE